MRLEGVEAGTSTNPDVRRAAGRDSVLRGMVKDMGAFIISEANVASFPGIVDSIRVFAPNSKVLWEISSWGGWIKPSQYWPLRSAFGQAAATNNWWLKYADGTQVIVGNLSTGLVGLVDITNPKALDWYVTQVNAARSKIKPDMLFYDEAHGTLGFLPRHAEIVLVGHGPRPPPPATRDSLWAQATGKLIRRTGGGMPNGTIRQSAASASIRGRYIQNTLRNVPASIEMALEHVAVDNHMLIMESPCVDSVEARTLVAIASLCGGAYQVTTGQGWRTPMLQPYLSGQWGKATSPPSDSRRTFERATVIRSAAGKVTTILVEDANPQ